MFSSENEVWFERENIDPKNNSRNEINDLQIEHLQASKSGLLPVKAIEQQYRTVQNVVYQSDSESEEDSLVHQQKIYTEKTAVNRIPVYADQNGQPHHPNHGDMLVPHTAGFFTPRQTWQPHEHNFVTQPALLQHMPQKSLNSISQSVMPCAWSYAADRIGGIAPHYSSSFFHRLRLMKNKDLYSSSAQQQKYPSQSQSQQQTMKRSDKIPEEEFGRRHSMFDQFLLHKDHKLQKLPHRRAQTQGT